MQQQQLIQRLEEKLQALFQTFPTDSKMPIFVRFDRSLFSEDFQDLAFYRQEIEQTFAYLKSLDTLSAEQFAFITTRLSAQCAALSDALRPKSKPTAPLNPINSKPVESSKAADPVHKLPPRERLEKYYEALRQLNEKIDECRDAAQFANDEAIRELALKRKAQYKLRRTKCLDAIELLEAYLAFKEEKTEKEILL
ncbi:primosomal replication protein PriC [Haemophilus pittmaniae]|nr:primosomal replication protein PriC [Haemophilus pittmaniae]